MPSILDSKWHYHNATSHADATAFRRRQRERMAAAQKIVVEAQAKVRQIKKQVAK